MLSIYDLYDLSAAFVNMRFSIDMKQNIEDANLVLIAEKIITALKNPSGEYQDNRIRRALASIETLDREHWKFVYHINYYVYHCGLKDEIILGILIKASEEVYRLLSLGMIEQAYDLIDMIHCLPDIIVENHMQITRSYWDSHVRPYRKKWDGDFLVAEQRRLYAKEPIRWPWRFRPCD